MSDLSEIRATVKGLPRKIGDIPNLVTKAMSKAGGGIVTTVAPITKILPTLKQPFEFSAGLIQYMESQRSTVKGESDKLRKQMTTYIGDLGICITQTNNLLRAVDKNLPQAGPNSAFAKELLRDVLNRIPDIALLPIAKALAGRPGWEKQVGQVTGVIVEMTQKVDSKSPQDQKDVDVLFIRVLTSLKMINGVLSLIIRLLPRDLAAGLSVVGGGGTLTLAGHPLAWVFVLSNWGIDEVHTVLSAAHQEIKLNR